MPQAADVFATVGRLEGVPSAMAAARDGIDAVLRRRSNPEVTAESLLRGAAASAALEGSRYTLEEVRAGDGDPVARGAVRLSTQLLGLSRTWQQAPLQALARMHAVAAGGLDAEPDLGRPRADPAVSARLTDLARRLLRPTESPALVVAALVHAEVAVLSPFHSVNGVVARAAERLVQVSRGVDPASVTVPEAGHLRLEAAYRPALQGYAAGGVREWLLYAARAYAQGAAESPLRS